MQVGRRDTSCFLFKVWDGGNGWKPLPEAAPSSGQENPFHRSQRFCVNPYDWKLQGRRFKVWHQIYNAAAMVIGSLDCFVGLKLSTLIVLYCIKKLVLLSANCINIGSTTYIDFTETRIPDLIGSTGVCLLWIWRQMEPERIPSKRRNEKSSGYLSWSLTMPYTKSRFLAESKQLDCVLLKKSNA